MLPDKFMCLGVYSTGSDPDVREKVRSFMGHANCRESFGFEEGKSYLIMGRSVDLPRIDEKYVNSSANQQSRHGLNLVYRREKTQIPVVFRHAF